MKSIYYKFRNGRVYGYVEEYEPLGFELKE